MTTRRPTALITDDEPLLRKSLARQLAQAWPELDVAAQARNGREAVDRFEVQQPDICFLDVHMPGLSGVDAARLIGRRAHLIFVTAYDQFAVQAFEQGALDYPASLPPDVRFEIQPAGARLCNPARMAGRRTMARRPETAYEPRVARAAAWIGLGAMVVGALVLWGWARDIAALKSVLPGLATMKANAAAGFVLGGASLWLSKPRSSDATRRWFPVAAPVLAAVVGALGLATLAEYGLGRDLGIDQLLFTVPSPAAGASPAGRMAAITALNFVLLAAGLLLLDVETRGGKRPANWFAFAIAVDSFLVILGYLYGIQSLSQVFALRSVALHAAALFLLLSIGLVCARPGSQFIRQIAANGPEGLVSRRLLPAAILVPPLVGWLRWEGELAGYYGTAFGLALFAASNVLIFALLAWWAARALGKSHDSLLASGQRMASLLESISDAFLSLDSQWRFVYINDKAAQTFGRSREQLLGRNIWVEFPHLVGQPFHRAYLQAMAERRYIFVEDGYEANDTWFENRIYPTEEGISVFVTVTTERKRAEIALSKSEQRLLEAQRLGSIGDWELNVATGGVSWSPQVYALYERDPASGAPSYEEFIAGCDAENRSIVEDNLNRLMETAKEQTYTFQMVLPSGVRVHHSVIAVPTLDASGKVTRVRGIVQDISERTRAESAVRQSEQQLRSVMDGLGPHMFVGLMDTRGVVLMANRPVRAAASLSEDDVIGRLAEETYWWTYSEQVALRLKAAVQRAAQGEAVRYDEQIRVAEGQLIWVDFSIHPLRDETGNVVSLVPSAVVITDRVQAREQLREAAARQQALARRLVEVQEDEHRRLSAELHDRIGQNLTALNINLNIIGSRSGQAHGDATVVRLGDSRKLLEQTIASVRDLITELRPAALDDYGLLAGLRWLGEQVLERTGLRVSVLGDELSPRLDPAVESAFFRISQEALTNIIKHAQAKNATLTLHRQEGHVSLGIDDDGCGFTLLVQPQSGPRSHWGLEMMRERAEAVGAQLRVESSPGNGTLVLIEMEVAP